MLSYFIFFLQIDGPISGKNYKWGGGGGELKAAVDGRPLYNCSLSALDFRNEASVDLVI